MKPGQLHQLIQGMYGAVLGFSIIKIFGQFSPTIGFLIQGDTLFQISFCLFTLAIAAHDWYSFHREDKGVNKTFINYYLQIVSIFFIGQMFTVVNFEGFSYWYLFGLLYVLCNFIRARFCEKEKCGNLIYMLCHFLLAIIGSLPLFFSWKPHDSIKLCYFIVTVIVVICIWVIRDKKINRKNQQPANPSATQTKRKTGALPTSRFGAKYLLEAATIILAVLGIFLACNGNKLSKASYELAKNDTSQQAQINKLTEIIGELRNQNNSIIENGNQLKGISGNSLEQLRTSQRTLEEDLHFSQLQNTIKTYLLRSDFDTIVARTSLRLYKFEADTNEIKRNYLPNIEMLRSLIERNVDNPVLANNKKNYDSWIALKSQINYYELSLNSLLGSYRTNDSTYYWINSSDLVNDAKKDHIDFLKAILSIINTFKVNLPGLINKGSLIDAHKRFLEKELIKTPSPRQTPE